MNTPIETPRLSKEDGTSSRKVGRRRFLGAGTVVAPVILTMVSQPALGVTCFTPSRSLSVNTSISQQGFYGECTGAQSPGNYGHQNNDGRPSYSWPISPETPFHPTFKAGSPGDKTLFTVTEGSTTRSMTMMEVLNLTGNEDPGKMAKHLIGAYLNCLGGNGAKINLGKDVVPADVVLKIWQEWVDDRHYEVTAGVYWGAEAIKQYLVNNGLISAIEP